MTRVRARGEQIRQYIVQNLDQHPKDIAKITADHFLITRQAVNKHLQRLVAEGAVVQEGKTRAQTYRNKPLISWSNHYSLVSKLEEDVVWRNDIAPKLGKLPENVLRIWNYGFTEMLNNAIDHSEGTAVFITFKKMASFAEITISDDGVGIFKKIQTQLQLLDERHAVLELVKGKLTTDPARHSGEGIFFTSRAFDEFDILSGGISFSHVHAKEEDWILERERFKSGTSVWMKLSNHSSRTLKKIFDNYTSGDDFGFNKTIVPVRLAQYGDDSLVSRSQAKRLLSRFDRFKTVLLDFEGVTSIGQAFADEVFRVFPAANPGVDLSPIKANAEVQRMINRAQSTE